MLVAKQMIEKLYQFIDDRWQNDIVQQLIDYIKIPNKSPTFDPDWEKNGYMDQAMELIVNWCKRQQLANCEISLLKDKGHTPLLLIEVQGEIDNTVLLYGHMDKQPEMTGWRDGLGPWQPVLEAHKLYGRGGADDGYAVFAALTAIRALQEHHIAHGRMVILIEASEESGSYDLPHYLQRLQQHIGSPDLIICLDSGCANYQQLWTTTSLRGIIDGKLTVAVTRSGVHSGYGSGVIPNPFRVLELLLDRIEDRTTGQFKLPAFQVDIPEIRQQQANVMATALGEKFIRSFPLLDNVKPQADSIPELILNRTWRPALSIIGMDGMPNIVNAGNVTLPSLSVKLSIRIPPTCATDTLQDCLKTVLEKDPPHNAKVSYQPGESAPGWHAPIESEWLISASNHASDFMFGKPMAYMGEGGSIPFMAMLGKMFPQAQFLITGVLGPHSNAHGPNEFLHIPMATKLTACVAAVISSHYERFK